MLVSQLTPSAADARNAAPGSYPRHRRPNRLDRREHFSLLVVRGDGTRVVRFNVPRRLPLVILAGVTLVVAALGVLVGDWWFTRARMREVAGLFSEVDAQRATISGFNRRMADVQQEIASWRDLHARIWEPFGPDAAPKGRGTGIGGPRTADMGSRSIDMGAPKWPPSPQRSGHPGKAVAPLGKTPVRVRVDGGGVPA